MLEILYDMVHEGKAAFKTYATGAAAVWRIPVPNNQYIVLTKIIYHPFIDSLDNTDSPASITLGMHHQLRLVTSKKYNVFQFRDEFNRAPGTIWNNFAPGQAQQRETYLIYDETLKINVTTSVAIPPSAWTNTNFIPLPAGADDPNQPIGYGTTLNTLFPFSPDAGTMVINPLSSNILTGGAANDAISTDQFETTGVLLNNLANQVPNQWTGISFPLIDFEYFQVFEPLPPCMRAK